MNASTAPTTRAGSVVSRRPTRARGIGGGAVAAVGAHNNGMNNVKRVDGVTAATSARPSRRRIVRCASTDDDMPPPMPVRDRTAKTLKLQIGESEVRLLPKNKK